MSQRGARRGTLTLSRLAVRTFGRTGLEKGRANENSQSIARPSRRPPGRAFWEIMSRAHPHARGRGGTARQGRRPRRRRRIAPPGPPGARPRGPHRDPRIRRHRLGPLQTGSPQEVPGLYDVGRTGGRDLGDRRKRRPRDARHRPADSEGALDLRAFDRRGRSRSSSSFRSRRCGPRRRSTGSPTSSTRTTRTRARRSGGSAPRGATTPGSATWPPCSRSTICRTPPRARAAPSATTSCARATRSRRCPRRTATP